MNKRVFLLLFFGFSFAPAVFAEIGDRSDFGSTRKVGEETIRVVSSRGVRCGHEFSEKVLPELASGSDQTKASRLSRSAK